jgi:hypothetical protein
MTNPPADTDCRLCHGATKFAFQTLVLAKHEVAFFCCQQCGSLQSQRPYWLAEAYATPASSIDPGSARRVLDSYVLVHVVARLLGCRKLLDFGGNTGFLCRLLRDQGYDAYSFDRYIAPIYAPHFVGSPLNQHDLVSAFEVIEHFDFPAKDLEQLFGSRPRVVLATTELFAGQSADWWYLAPREGQHIFFYSHQAARLIAEQYGYRVLIGRGFLLFSRTPLSAVRRLLIGLLRPRILQILGAIFLSKRGTGAERDFAVLSQRAPRTEKQ